MASNSNFSLALVSIASFVGGIAVGMLMAPKSGTENRKWVREQAEGAAKWVDKQGHEALHKAEDTLDSIKNNIKEEYEKSIPNLYKATEKIHLEEDDLI